MRKTAGSTFDADLALNGALQQVFVCPNLEDLRSVLTLQASQKVVGDLTGCV